MSTAPQALPRFYRRLSATERVFAAFMAACACIILGLSAFILIRGWDSFASPSDRQFVLAVTVGALVAAGFFLRTLRKGRSLAPIHDSEETITSMVAAAALGDPEAVVALQHFREAIRRRVEVLDLLPPAQLPRIRGAYSIAVATMIKCLAELDSPLVEGDTSDAMRSKESVASRLEGELAVWNADFAWFERLEARLPT